MSQINYRIIRELAKKDNHIRGLAEAIGSNQTTIARKVKELQEKNVVDFRTEGKNKVCFLKKTLEAKEHIMIIEHFRLIGTISKHPRLRRITEWIKNNKDIRLAILFGSYVTSPSPSSDIDIYIETKSRKLKERIELLDTKASVKTGEFDQKNPLIKEIMKKHVIIKGVERYYELVH